MAAVKQYDAYIPGLNALLRDLKGLDKDAQGELRTASTQIATRYMVPAWQAAARGAGPWGDVIAGTVKAKRDRLPAVQIGANRRKAFSGGASANMVRYPSHAGRVRESIPAAFVATGWMRSVKPAYLGDAIREWGQAVDTIVTDFNRGPDY
jgi:hypothetical protein